MNITLDELHAAILHMTKAYAEDPQGHLAIDEAAENPEYWADELLFCYTEIIRNNRNKETK